MTLERYLYFEKHVRIGIIEVIKLITIQTNNDKEYNLDNITQVIVYTRTNGTHSYELSEFLDVKDVKRYVFFHGTDLVMGLNLSDIKSITVD